MIIAGKIIEHEKSKLKGESLQWNNWLKSGRIWEKTQNRKRTVKPRGTERLLCSLQLSTDQELPVMQLITSSSLERPTFLIHFTLCQCRLSLQASHLPNVKCNYYFILLKLRYTLLPNKQKMFVILKKSNSNGNLSIVFYLECNFSFTSKKSIKSWWYIVHLDLVIWYNTLKVILIDLLFLLQRSVNVCHSMARVRSPTE